MPRYEDEDSASDTEMNDHQAQPSQTNGNGDFDEADWNRRRMEQRKIRTEYRKLISETEVNRKEFLDPLNNGLLDNVDQANRLFKNDLGVEKSRHLRIGQAGFDESEYLTRLVNRMGGHEIEAETRGNGAAAGSSSSSRRRRRGDAQAEGDVNNDDGDDDDDDDMEAPSGGLDWSRIGRIASRWTRRVPTMDFMLGPMSVEHRARQMGPRTRIVRDPKLMRKPQELQEADIARQENETTKNVVQICNILEQANGRVNLFNLVINPESFGQTVENIFYLSFLIRDGQASIVDADADNPESDLEEGGDHEGKNIQPMVEACEVPTAQDYENGLHKKQLVMNIDMATWREIIEVYDIRKPMIPTRPIREEHVVGKWYG
ncbi:nuclear protein [Actinomortierella ambigua]|uniref:Non-structural maintenance of chromosomes element 4 n=1 Tax=Actinomortierella ambigua TaxID=1343610 RepID=A0A9P6U229_9FUNG|nr:nuclear protein [Actinomortierella ambigua]